jgi:hypothetical protein
MSGKKSCRTQGKDPSVAWFPDPENFATCCPGPGGGAETVTVTFW